MEKSRLSPVLSNGNIATMASKTPQFASQGGADWVQQFEYDQLNRITASSTLEGATVNNKWKTGYSYDAGGNIKSLQRYDKDGAQFDAMSYNYENTASNQNYKTNTNKLRWVDDTEPVADYASDIDDQDVGNYTYDDIGNLIADKAEEIASIEWDVYGKVKKVTRLSSSIKPDLEFAYDVAGRRILKVVKNKGGNIDNTFYLRDAMGNVLSIYETTNGSSLVLEEQHVYGSSRLGIFKPINGYGHVIGQKEYEIEDHLGNIRVVLSDKVVGGITNVINATDYLPFGMTARSFSPTYRYGYNGKEKENELAEGDYDFGARIYDARLGRWMKLDILQKAMPGWTPYRYALDNPLKYFDADGNFEIDAATAKKYPQLNAQLKQISVVYANKPEEFKKLFKAYSELSDAQVKEMLTYGKGPKIEVKNIGDHNSYGSTPYTGGGATPTKPKGNIILNEYQVNELEKAWKSPIASEVTKEAKSLVIEVTLFHELVHYGDLLDGKDDESRPGPGGTTITMRDELGWDWEEIAYGKNISDNGISKENAVEYVKKNNYKNAVNRDKIKLEKLKSTIKMENQRKIIALPDATRVSKPIYNLKLK